MGTYYMPDTVLGLGVYRVVEKMLPVQTSKRKKKRKPGDSRMFYHCNGKMDKCHVGVAERPVD